MSVTAKLTAALVLLLGMVGSHWYAYKAGNRNGTNATEVKNQRAELKRQDEVIDGLQRDLNEAEAQRNRLAEQSKQARIDHEKEMERVRRAERAAAGQRVRIDKDLFCGTQGGATESAAPSGDGQGDAPSAFLPDWFAADLRQAAAQADEVSADLRSLKRQVDEAACF